MSTGMGAAFGTAKSGIGIAGVGTFRPDLIMKVGRKLLAAVRLLGLFQLSSLLSQWSWLESLRCMPWSYQS